MLAFVEVFKDEVAEFFAGSVLEAAQRLMRAQEEASFESLFERLEGLVSPDTQAYFEEFRWAKVAPDYTERKPHCSL